FDRRHLVPPASELSDTRTAWQLFAQSPGARSPRLHRFPLTDGRLSLLPGQPGGPASAAQGAGAQGTGTAPPLLPVQRRLPAHRPLGQVERSESEFVKKWGLAPANLTKTPSS